MNHVPRVLLAATLLLFVAVSLNFAQVSRDSAITLVTDQVITPSPDIATLVAFIYDPPGADSLLAAGTDVAPRDSAFITTLSGPKWFFWIDLTGNIRFKHPTKFVFVDPVTGSVDVTDGGWWPAITPPAEPTVQPWSTINERIADVANTVYGGYTGVSVPPIAVPMTVPGRSDQPNRDIRVFRLNALLSGNTCAILVGGGAGSKGEENAWQGDLDSMHTAMTEPGPGGTDPIADEVQEKNNATKADIQKMIDSAQAHGCNSIIFYYSGHGNDADGGSMYLQDVDLGYDDLATMLNISGLKFKDVMLDNCYGGTSLDDFGGKTTTVTIITAADSTHTSTGTVTFVDSNGNHMIDPEDSIKSGSGDYTRAWMACWRKLRDSLNRNPTLKEVHDWVRHVNPDSINQKQNPSSSTIYPIITFELNIPGPGLYQFLGTDVNINFNFIGGPTDVTVTRTLGPAQGQIDPIETEIVSLSLVSVWSIQMNPPQPFQAGVYFGFAGSGSAGDGIPMEEFALSFRPSPSLLDPDPLWHVYPNFDYVPSGPGILAFNVTEFSEWAYALLAGADTTIDVPHAAKWNMLSVPLQAADMHKDTLFPDAVSEAFAYNGSYTTETVLENGPGYWLKFSGAGSNALFGAPIHLDSIDVVSGWNMVGSITDPVSVGSITTIPPGMSLSTFFGYDGGYSGSSTIEPGMGYWVKAPSAGSLILDGGFVLAKNTPPPDYSAFNRLELRDAAGQAQSLYFGPAGAAQPGMTTEMPPPPPRGMFDARFADGSFIELYSGRDARDYGVQVTSARYPLTLTWDIADGESRELTINGSTRMSGRGSLVMKEAGPVTITAGAPALPGTYSLAQNYPNPFNPVTKIVYELPAGSKVTLTVFDILGREVAVLADGVQEAGVKTVEFNAAGLPSGVYFYRLKAGNFTAVRKLMLMR